MVAHKKITLGVTMQKLVLFLAGFLFLSSSAYSFSRWDDLNRPTIFEKDYEYNLKKLSKSGFLSVIPWSDDYYPTEKGGISYRWNQKNFTKEVELFGYNLLNMNELASVNIAELSPAEKWDIFIGDKDWSLTNYERKRTKVLRTVPGSSVYDPEYKIPSWEGLCHSWAPATLLFENPEPVTMISLSGVKVPFGASDIKALLTMFMDTNESDTKFLGSRCNLSKKELKEKLTKGEITPEEYAEAMVALSGPECDGVNPGAFHIVLANQLKNRDEGFIIDITRDAEVWNQPVIGYETQMGRPEEGSSAGSAEGTAFQIYVRTKMYYIAEIPMSFTSEFKRESVNAKIYDYILELDKDFNILGGKWVSEDRPDFIWKRDRPEFKGYFEPLEGIYKKSIEHVRRLRFIHAANHLGNLNTRADSARERVASARTVERFQGIVRENQRVSRFIERIKEERLETKFQDAIRRERVLRNFRRERLEGKFQDAVRRERYISTFSNLATIRKERDEALLKAVREKDNKKIQELINSGADVNGKRFNLLPEYLLNEVIYKGNAQIVKLFIEKKATLETPLLRAMEVMDMEIIDLLLSSGAKTSIQTSQGESMLMLATKHNHLMLAQKLLKVNPASLENKDKLGRNALIATIIGLGNPPDLNTFELVKFLVGSGINTETKDSFGKTALDYVKTFRSSPNNAHKKIKSFLEKNSRNGRVAHR